jgi:ATP-dependent RNA helicase DDX27
MEEDAEIGDAKLLNAAIRSAKKSARPAKIGMPENQPRNAKDKKRRPKVTARSGGAFERDMTVREGIRAKKSDAVGLKGKKRGKVGKKA